MFKQWILILVGFLIIGTSDNIFAQMKITPETKNFPINFEGHDPAILFANLNAFLKGAKGKNAEAVRESLKRKAIYENLTTDDLFAFTLDAAEYVWGRNKNNNLPYRGAIFPLRNLKDIPSPQPKYLTGMGFGTGGGDTLFSSIKELAPEFSGSQSLETLWTTSYLPIKTVYPPEALAKKYIGRKAICQPSPYLPNALVCDGRDFSVPSPQIHYGIAFVKAQPFSLVSVDDENLSLQTYKFTRPKLPGIAAWLENGEQYSGAATPIFIVRLVAPYLASENYEMPDAVEQKPHRAVRSIIYVELAAIWIYNKQTGNILSKNGEQSIVPNSVANQENQRSEPKIIPPISGKNVSPDTPLNIISKPHHLYTEEARKNNLMGIVKLKVTFLASGQIGKISVVEGLPDGLTEQAVKAARGIRFSPAIENGVPITVTKIVTYPFTIY